MSKQKTLAFAVAYVTSVCEYLNHASSVAAIVSAEKSSIASGLVSALFTLRDTAPDTGAYLTACEYAHGNGLRHTAKDYQPGEVQGWLTNNKVPADTIKVYKSKLATVARWLADPVNNGKRTDAKGDALSLDALYKLAKLAKNPVVATANVSNAPDAPAPAPAPETLSQLIAKYGVVHVLTECAAILRVERKSKTDAIALETIAAKYA